MQKTKYLLKNFEALGTIWFIEVFDYDSKKITTVIRESIIQEIKQFEKNYSRFLPTSKLNKLNKNRRYLNASKEFIDLINKGLCFWYKTNGNFNFGLADILACNGYGKIVVKQDGNHQEFNLQKSIVIEDNNIYLDDKLVLDFGGFGKGYLIDKIAKILKNKFDINYFLINGGGDIFVTNCGEEPVMIHLQDPINLNKTKFSVKMKNSALCASSTYKRQWINNKNIIKTHILNPNYIDETLLNKASFVFESSCVNADMLATTLCINNSSKFIETLKNNFSFTYITG